MPQINARMDVGQVHTASNQLVADLQKIDERIAKVTSTTAVFNSRGIQTGSVVKGLTKDGKEFAATLGLVDAAARKAAAAGIATNAQLGVMSLRYRDVKKDVKDVVEETSRLTEVTGRLIKTSQYFLAYRGYSFLANQLEDGVRAANRLQIQLALIRTLSQDSQQTFGKFSSDVRGVSDRTGFDINETAKAFYDTVSNQVAKGEGAAPFVEEAAKLARLTDSTITDSVNALTSTINAYNLKADSAARLSAIWFKTIDEGRINMGEVANTIGRVDAIASNLGISIEEVRAVLAITTQQGFKTSDALTLLTNLMIKLEKPTQGTERLFKKLGVSSGEAAIQLKGGLVGVMKEIIESTRTGEAEISDFFDEIRGRKQAAIFETALPKIAELADKMKDVNRLQEEYNNAQKIRDEPAADKVNKRLNAFANIFKEDLGQKIQNLAFQTLQVGDAIGDFVGKNEAASVVVDGLAIATTGYIGILAVHRTATLASTAATAAFGAANASALGPIGALAAAVAALTYVTGRAFVDEFSVQFKQTNPEDIRAVIAGIKDLKKTKDSLAADKDGLAIISDESKGKFKDALNSLAQLQVKNDQILGEAKVKAKESADAIKLYFDTYADRIKNSISEIKRGITESRNEIDKSAKSLLGFKDTLDNIIFESQNRFATDEQKVGLTENRISQMIDKADKLLRSTDPATRDEGRRLVDEIARNIQQVEDLKNNLAAQQAKDSGASLYVASTENLQRRLAQLYQFREEREKSIQQLEQKGIIDKTKAAEEETTRLRKLQAAFKEFEDLTFFDKSGKVSKDFQDGNGRFDENKAKQALDGIADRIRESAGAGFSERLSLEIQLSNRKLNLVKEVAAAERQEYFKTQQAKLQGDQDRLNQAIADESKRRQGLNDKTKQGLTNLGQTADLFQEFAKAQKSGFLTDNPFGIGGNKLDLTSRANKDFLAEYQAQLFALDGQIKATKDNAQNLNGVLVPREQDIVRLQELVDLVERSAQETQNRLGKPNEQPIVDGVSFSDAIANARRQIEELKARGGDAAKSRLQEETLKQQRDSITDPLSKLQTAFPDLISRSDEAQTRLSTGFQRMAESANPLLDKVRAIQAEMQKLAVPGAGPVSLANEGDAAYAATGGVVGAFPGQPRGQDRYPVWAAKDEYIVNAGASRSWRPLLEAINSGKAPSYMNQGGNVGGDTTVGDITVHVHNTGGSPIDGRTLARTLEREIRRGNVRFRK